MSESGAWYDGFDVVDLETTPISDVPEADGFHLICPVEGCDHEAEFENLFAITASEWSEMSRKDHILTDGTTLKEAYCPAHSLDETEVVAFENADDEFEDFTAYLQAGLGTPLDVHEAPKKPEQAKPEYAMYDFAEGKVTLDGSLLTCGHDSCYRQEEVDAPEDAEDVGWVSGQMVGILSDGRMLFEGRCSEHQE